MARKPKWWSKKAEKERKREEQELAKKKAKDRADSEDRHETIKVLWDLDKHQISASKKAKDRKLTEQKLKLQKLKDLRESVSDSTENDNLVDRIKELIELVLLQDLEIDYLMQFRGDWELIEAHYPDRLENLYTASIHASIFRPGLAAELPAVREQQNWEHKRQRYKLPSGVGLIEYEFGGVREAEWRKSSLLYLPYQPTCLDKIFRGGAVKMHEVEGDPGLQNLFGMHRNRFPKNLPAGEKGRETWYDYRAVVKVMHRLLSEPRKSGTPARGRATRPWPINPGLRTGMLTGIISRMERLSVSGEIWDAFTAVVCLHICKGNLERLPEDEKAWLETLVRRYLADSAKK